MQMLKFFCLSLLIYEPINTYVGEKYSKEINKLDNHNE